MHASKALVFLAAAAGLSTAMPASGHHKQINTPVDFYQGGLDFSGQSLSSTDGTCADVKVASGAFTGGACNDLHTIAIGIHQLADKQCTFTMWTGIHTCNGTSKPIEIVIPKGNETTCIDTGVLDGGLHYVASGIYKCH